MLQILKTKSKKDKKHSKKYIYCASALKGLLFFSIGFVALSFLLMKSNGNSMFYYIFGYVLIAFGAFISGFSAYKKLRGRGFQNGIIASAVYFVAVFMLIIFCMRFTVNIRLLLILPIALGSGFLGGVAGANT